MYNIIYLISVSKNKKRQFEKKSVTEVACVNPIPLRKSR